MQISAADRTLAFLGYLPFLPFWILPIKFRKTSLFAQFHGRQAFMLWCMWFVASLICAVLLFFVTSHVGSLVIFGVLSVLLFVYLFLTLIAIIKVLLGERYRMPVVADMALFFRL